MRSAPLVLALLLLAGAGVFDLLRASSHHQRRASGVDQAKLDLIPMDFGEWKGEAQSFDDKMLKATRAIAHLSRRYTRGGPKPASISVLMLAGEPGEIGAHDPERCYGGSGFRSLGVRVRKTAADVGVTHSLWSEKFSRETLPAGSIEVCWGWTPDGHWQASDDARLDYATRSVLYKIYLSRSLGANESDADPTADLLAELAPLARTALAKP